MAAEGLRFGPPVAGTCYGMTKTVFVPGRRKPLRVSVNGSGYGTSEAVISTGLVHR